MRSAGNLLGTTRSEPARRVRGAAVGSERPDLRRGCATPAPRQKTHGPPFGCQRVGREVRGPARALGRDDHPAAHHRVPAQLRHENAHLLFRPRLAREQGRRAPRRTGLPSKSTAATSSQIGIGTPRLARQPQRGGDGAHALGDHGRGAPRPRRRLRPLRDLAAERAVPAQRARAGQDEVAETGEAGEGRGLGAERHAEPRPSPRGPA